MALNVLSHSSTAQQRCSEIQGGEAFPKHKVAPSLAEPTATNTTEQHPQTSDTGKRGSNRKSAHPSTPSDTPQLPAQTGAAPRHSPAHTHLTQQCQSVPPERGSRSQGDRAGSKCFTLYLKFYMPPAYMKVAHSEFDSLRGQRARCKHKCQTSAWTEEPEPRSL